MPAQRLHPPFSIALLLQAWVSWAQFEKRMERLADQSMARFDKTREVLQRGLTLNPSSAALCQVMLSHPFKFCGFLDLGAGHLCVASGRRVPGRMHCAADMITKSCAAAGLGPHGAAAWQCPGCHPTSRAQRAV